ncbi:hypothetical protein V0R50_10850 [Pseudomonas sp. 148P]|uniref:Uncharacterized protein n=1 Tax=Pseudomonas ulcerans TaxID=3115852 RepID=A0ABU7HQD4_9PSED|nr:hypothetical protein [Pseudomonas sp. 148P]MEE1922742.1 hypothetical protein [Pseudomonas sp. 147P]MEE1933719.1 hypothetical protein [Pseudomonas sp. 148P]
MSKILSGPAAGLAGFMLGIGTAFAQAKRVDGATIAHPGEILQAPARSLPSTLQTPRTRKPMIYLALRRQVSLKSTALFSQRKIIPHRETQSI